MNMLSTMTTSEDTECTKNEIQKSLIGFPDNWTRISWRGKPPEECPDRHRYKACGNSMCVNVMRWIGKRIQQVEDKER